MGSESNTHLVIMIITLIFSITTAAVVLYFFFRKQIISKSDVTNLNEVPEVLSKQYFCPKCNREMKTGFSIASRGIIWRDKNEKRSLFAMNRLLPNTLNMGFKVKENLTWNCKNCELLIFDYSRFIR